MPHKAKLHVHIPGPMMHDDHMCLHVLCAICQTPGLLINGLWADLTSILNTQKES
ncbi:hypothetical protein ACIOD2_32380 [Amycolatopsis sp. NPDC088138]|uniref:hypothetical protein n=1 Tax=Amycolatopsis sp. NPDC088138 TaxID=3363938 RepID=UPI00381AC921